jgi:hypothetical protein
LKRASEGETYPLEVVTPNEGVLLGVLKVGDASSATVKDGPVAEVEQPSNAGKVELAAIDSVK